MISLDQKFEDILDLDINVIIQIILDYSRSLFFLNENINLIDILFGVNLKLQASFASSPKYLYYFLIFIKFKINSIRTLYIKIIYREHNS